MVPRLRFLRVLTGAHGWEYIAAADLLVAIFLPQSNHFRVPMHLLAKVIPEPEARLEHRIRSYVFLTRQFLEIIASPRLDAWPLCLTERNERLVTSREVLRRWHRLHDVLVVVVILLQPLAVDRAVLRVVVLHQRWPFGFEKGVPCTLHASLWLPALVVDRLKCCLRQEVIHSVGLLDRTAPLLSLIICIISRKQLPIVSVNLKVHGTRGFLRQLLFRRD